MWGFGCGMGWGGGIVMIGGLILLALVIFWLIVSLTRNQGGRMELPRGNDPRFLETLKQRYARGEINKEQFDQMKRDLQP